MGSRFPPAKNLKLSQHWNEQLESKRNQLKDMTKNMKRVLVVDNEPDIRDLLAEMIRELHVEVDQADNGRTAIEMIRATNYDAVVCDILMPEMSGLECLELAHLEEVKVPFILVSACDDVMELTKAQRLGAIDLLTKPFDPDQVSKVILRALDVEHPPQIV